MSNKNLFQSVKKFINSKEPGKTFTTKEFHDAMRGIESQTFWKAASKNEFYRSDVYRGYLKRLGFVEMFIRGTWRIIAPIPSWVDSGTANFVLGYMNTYTSKYQRPTHYHDLTLQETKQKIADHIKKFEKTKQENSMKYHEFKVGNRVKILENLGGSINKVGEVGVITEVAKYSLKVSVLGNDDDANWHGHSEVELTDEPLSNTQIVETTQREYIYAVVTNSVINVFKEEDEAKKLVRENAAKHGKLSKIYKVEFDGAPFGFDLHDFQFFGGKEIDMAKELARELVGSGKYHGRSAKNLWFVTEGPYHMVNKDGDSEYELLDGYSAEDTRTYGPFLSYEDACEKYDELDLNAYSGIGQVCIEDRWCGQVKEKFIEKKIVIDYDYNEHDDSHLFYGK
jgi:hypothetical protein